MQGDGEVLHAIATRAANGLGWFVFRAQQWTLAVWRDEPSGRILVAPCATVGERAGEVVGAARLDEGLVGSLPIALPVDPILQRVADCLWSADPARRERPPSSSGSGPSAGNSTAIPAHPEGRGPAPGPGPGRVSDPLRMVGPTPPNPSARRARAESKRRPHPCGRPPNDGSGGGEMCGGLRSVTAGSAARARTRPCDPRGAADVRVPTPRRPTRGRAVHARRGGHGPDGL